MSAHSRLRRVRAAPYGVLLGRMCCVKPFQRCRARCGAYLTQQDLNEGFLGTPFNLAFRYAQALMVVFVTMLYCGGLPLLMPLACVALGFRFWMDKVRPAPPVTLRTHCWRRTPLVRRRC